MMLILMYMLPSYKGVRTYMSVQFTYFVEEIIFDCTGNLVQSSLTK